LTVFERILNPTGKHHTSKKLTDGIAAAGGANTLDQSVLRACANWRTELLTELVELFLEDALRLLGEKYLKVSDASVCRAGGAYNQRKLKHGSLRGCTSACRTFQDGHPELRSVPVLVGASKWSRRVCLALENTERVKVLIATRCHLHDSQEERREVRATYAWGRGWRAVRELFQSTLRWMFHQRFDDANIGLVLCRVIRN